MVMNMKKDMLTQIRIRFYTGGIKLFDNYTG